MTLDKRALMDIMPKLTEQQAEEYLPHILAAADKCGIDNIDRMAAWLAQIAHESGELRYWEEIWGPTRQQLRYEPGSKLAQKLGNTQKGDGFRYRGRGPIQLTGRHNYSRYGNLLKLDLVSRPDQVATPEAGFLVAGTFWLLNGLNELADKRLFQQITKRVNGGLTGLASRSKYYKRALRALKEAHIRANINKSVEAPTHDAGGATVASGGSPAAGGLQPAGDAGGVGKDSGSGPAASAQQGPGQ
jgi:putative chitinase